MFVITAGFSKYMKYGASHRRNYIKLYDTVNQAFSLILQYLHIHTHTQICTKHGVFVLGTSLLSALFTWCTVICILMR